MKQIKGSKGEPAGGKPPVEAPNTLRSTALARILDLWSEGEIVGLADGLKSIYLNETPIQNSDDTFNFQNVLLEYRYGTQTQDHISGFPFVENEVGVGVELTSVTSWTQAFSNLQLDAIRVRISTSSLTTTDVKTGNINGGYVGYAIDLSTDGGPFNEILTSAFNGKCISEYERSHRIELPPQTTGSVGWQIRVRRTTANSSLVSVQDKTFIKSYTEVIDAKLRYPNSALCGIVFDAQQFQSIPSRAYDMIGRIIRVPSNYDAETRVYTGIWDGTWQMAWTDNPAWIFYDLATHPRYGLGHLISDSQVNKWGLYTIAQYCDELVPDGFGGMEPRFTCNLYLQTQAEAYKVLQDLGTCFRGMTYWSQGEVYAVSDMPEEPVHTYTRANVIEGEFNYQGSARKTRATVALVSWQDQSDFGRQKVEYVDDQDGIARYGVQQVESTAIGCNSRGQALRLGKYLLLTGILDTDTVSFSVGLEGTIVQPGRLVRIADPVRAGRRLGGRIADSGSIGTDTEVYLDAPVVGVVVGDEITITRAVDGLSETRTILSVDVTGRQVTTDVAFSEVPKIGNVWAIDRATVQTQRYRILTVTETENNQFAITAVRHNESKFDAVDLGYPIEIPPISDYPAIFQAPPTDVTITATPYSATSVVATHVVISWTAPAGAVDYEVEYQRDNGLWIFVARTSGLAVEIPNSIAGNYLARTRAINAIGIKSRPAESDETLVIDPIDVSGYYSLPLEIVGGYVDVDCTLSEHFSLELTADATLRLINAPSSERVVIIEVTQRGTGSDFDLTMDSNITPALGVVYVSTKITTAQDVLGFYTNSKGVAWQMRFTLNVNVAIGGPIAGLFAATITPNPAYGYATSNPFIAVAATLVNGTPSYTYLWTRAPGGSGDWGGTTTNTGGPNFVCSTPTGPNPTFSRTGGSAGYTTQNWLLTVTDSAGLHDAIIFEIGLEDDGAIIGGRGDWECPSVYAWLPATDLVPMRQAGTVQVGEDILAIDPDTGVEFMVTVTQSTPAWQPGYWLITESGVELTCSKTAPIPLRAGGVRRAVDMLGYETYVQKDGIWHWSEVIGVESVGMIAVQHITCDNKFFLVGDNQGAYMAHHNIKYEP